MNYLAIVIATVVQFIIGAIWYTPVFGNLWGRIHGFDRHSPEEQAKMRAQMLPLLAVQFICTLVTSLVYALLLNGFEADWNRYGLAAFLWLGFVVPTQVAAVLFGGTEPKWVVTKTLIMAGGSLLCLEALAFVIAVMA